LSKDERDQLWDDLHDEILLRHKAALDNAVVPGEVAEAPGEVAPGEAHARQAANPLFDSLDEFIIPDGDVEDENDLVEDADDANLSASIKAELRKLRARPRDMPDVNPLETWKKTEGQYPLTAPVARAILAIPATSAPSERVFSVAGLFLRKNRCTLDSTTVEVMVFLHGFYKFMDANPSFLRT
jgi:hypothetical protein